MAEYIPDGGASVRHKGRVERPTNTLSRDGRVFVVYTELVKVVFPIPRKISLNRIYAGVHFRERSKHKDEYYMAVLSKRPAPYTGPFPVRIHYHFKLAGKQLDIDNHGYMEKMLADSLVHVGVLPDDTPQYIGAKLTTASKAKKGEYDTVEVTITAV